MNLRVYYNARKRMPSVAEVQAALPADLRMLEVVDRQDFICVFFPPNTPSVSKPARAGCTATRWL